jgi:hypothetical protein
VKPLALIEGQLYPTSWRTLARMVIAGAVIARRGHIERIPRRACWRTLAYLARRWFDWTTALPGDCFWLPARDLLVEVRGGLPSRRRIAVLPGMALQFPIVRELGVDAAFATCPSEPTTLTWKEIARHG